MPCAALRSTDSVRTGAFVCAAQAWPAAPAAVCGEYAEHGKPLPQHHASAVITT
jgi:hypothetical protein